MGCDHKTHVRLENRNFVVEYDADGAVLRIKERKTFGTLSSRIYETSWWTAKSHVLGSGMTMPKRIIELARQKMAAEDRAIGATP